MCCLAYEYETYLSLKKNFPRIGKRVRTPQGEGKVVKHNALNATVSVQLDEGKEISLALKDVSVAEQPKGNQPPGPADRNKVKNENERGQAGQKQPNSPEQVRPKHDNPRGQARDKQSGPGNYNKPKNNNGQRKNNNQSPSSNDQTKKNDQ
jgi:hypothetical protein